MYITNPLSFLGIKEVALVIENENRPSLDLFLHSELTSGVRVVYGNAIRASA